MANIMLNYILKLTKYKSFYQKYAIKKYQKVHLLTTSAWLVTYNHIL